MIEDDLLEAVIGVAPFLFYGTGIPACILVLRQRVQNGAERVSGKPKERQGKVLFINADREFLQGRAQNFLMPEHIEKIVTTFEAYKEEPGFSAIVDTATLKASGYNLNIRRYADNAPSPEPHDVRAHLLGGVPKAEVAHPGKKALFDAHGLNPMDFFVERDGTYYDFQPSFTAKTELKPAIESNAGLQAKEAAIRAAFETWWTAHSQRITDLAGAQSFVALRNELLASFSGSLEQIGLLDPFQVRGIVAGFWNQTKYDFLTLMARGSHGVVDAWRTSIVTALEDKAKKESPLEHKLVKFLMGNFVDEIEDLEAKKVELEAQIKASDASEEEGGEGEEAAETEDDDAVDEAQLKAKKKDLEGKIKEITRVVKVIERDKKANASALKKLDKPKTQQANAAEIATLQAEMAAEDAELLIQAQKQQAIEATLQPILDQLAVFDELRNALKDVKKDLADRKKVFADHLNSAVDGLAPEAAAKLLLTILHDDMKRIVERYVTGQRQLIVAAFENWWDKYKVTLTEIERDRDAAASQLQQFLKGLKYV
jgi:type I restriction enzyme M protein